MMSHRDRELTNNVSDRRRLLQRFEGRGTWSLLSRLPSACWLVIFFLTWTSAWAQNEGGAYQATSDYVLQLGDDKIEDAEIFYSRRHVAYLVISGELEMPLIVRIPEETVGQISAETVVVDAQRASARLEAEASERRLSGIERRLKEIRFKLGDSSAALVPAAAIVGWHTPQTIRSRDPVMRSSFSRSKSSAPRLKAITLPPHQELLVEVFFGSWDGYSQLVMPKIMQLEEEVGSSTAHFAYYGLPKRIADDPLGVERSISGVPTLVVSVDGAEVGRLTGRALHEPSASLGRLLGGEPE